MRGTNIETEIKDIEITAVALVESPAIGERFVLVKSEDEKTAPAADVTAGVVAPVEKSPQSPNSMTSLAPTVDDGRDKVVEAVKALVKSATDWPMDVRWNVAQIAKYHGVEAPDMKAAEAPPAGLDTAIQRLEQISGLLQQIVVAQASQPAVVTPAPAAKPAGSGAKPVKKDGEDDSEAAAAAAEDVMPIPADTISRSQANLRAARQLAASMEALTRSLRKAMGKDPDGDR